MVGLVGPRRLQSVDFGVGWADWTDTRDEHLRAYEAYSRHNAWFSEVLLLVTICCKMLENRAVKLYSPWTSRPQKTARSPSLTSVKSSSPPFCCIFQSRFLFR